MDIKFDFLSSVLFLVGFYFTANLSQVESPFLLWGWFLAILWGIFMGTLKDTLKGVSDDS